MSALNEIGVDEVLAAMWTLHRESVKDGGEIEDGQAD
jgi:hypothetical protein